MSQDPPDRPPQRDVIESLARGDSKMSTRHPAALLRDLRGQPRRLEETLVGYHERS